GGIKSFSFFLQKIQQHALSGSGKRDMAKTAAAEVAGQQLGLVGLAVDQADLTDLARQGRQEGEQLIMVGVSGEAIQLDDLGPEVPAATEKAHGRPRFQELPAQRVRRL